MHREMPAHPAHSLLGIAQAASQGAITARQLGARPIMRAGEVLETVPGPAMIEEATKLPGGKV